MPIGNERFAQFFANTPAATLPLSTEPMLVLQNGVTKQVPVGGVGGSVPITIGGTPTIGGTDTYVLFDNAGVIGEESPALFNKPQAEWAYNTTGHTIGGGQMFDAKLLPGGTLLYACGRNVTASKVGVSEINPVTGEEIFNWHDPRWVTDGTGTPAGPESVWKYSNGNYLIATVDGGVGTVGFSVYEMTPTNSVVWGFTYNASVGTNLADPATINGMDCVIVYGTGNVNRTGLTIIKRGTAQILLDIPNISVGPTEISGGCFRVIGGVNTILAGEWDGVHAYKITFDSNFGSVTTTSYNFGALTGAPSAFFSAEWLDDNTVVTAAGFSGTVAVIRLSPLTLVWQSGILGYDSIGDITPTTCVNLLPGNWSVLTTNRNKDSDAGFIFFKVLNAPLFMIPGLTCNGSLLLTSLTNPGYLAFSGFDASHSGLFANGTTLEAILGDNSGLCDFECRGLTATNTALIEWPGTNFYQGSSKGLTVTNTSVVNSGVSALTLNSPNSTTASSRNWAIATNNTSFGTLEFLVSSTKSGDPATTILTLASNGAPTFNGNATFITGANSNVNIAKEGGYNILSLNGAVTDAANQGLTAGNGSDPVLYIEVADNTNGRFDFLFANTNTPFTVVPTGPQVGSGGLFLWSSTAAASGTPDTGISRTAAAAIGFGNGAAGNTSATLTGKSFAATGDPGGTASQNTFSNVNSTTISTGTGTVKMSSANNANNTGWLKCYIGTQVAWIPCWTTNAP